jgi:hypothetical protein
MSAAARSVLLGDLSSAVSAAHKGVEEGTHQKHTLAWSRWSQWLRTVELFNDEFLEAFLETFLPQAWTRLLGAFASAIRFARFSGPTHTQLASGSVYDTVNHVAASFVNAGFNDPRRTEIGGPSLRFLQRQYKC